MNQLVVKTGSEDDFFKRGRKLAELVDRGECLPEESVISFEDPADVLKLLTTARLALFRAIKAQPGSITAISERLHRDRSAVKRDRRIGSCRVGDGRAQDTAGAWPDERSTCRRPKLQIGSAAGLIAWEDLRPAVDRTCKKNALTPLSHEEAHKKRGATPAAR